METKRYWNRKLRSSKFRFFFAGIMLLMGALACNLPMFSSQQPQPPVDEQEAEQVSAAIEASLTAEAKQDDQKALPSATEEDQPPPSETPQPTLTATQEATATPTPEGSFVDIEGNTNCRVGPGSVYDLVEIYLAGARAKLIGKNLEETFWYVQNLEDPGLECWLWGKYATPEGDTDLLPVFTPPPTPTPSVKFTVSYAGSDCGAGSCWLWFKINNSSGGIKLESVKVFAQNNATNDKANKKSDVFKDGIAGSDLASISPGNAGFTHSGQLPNPSGDKVYVEITACSKNNLGGFCLTKNLTVKP